VLADVPVQAHHQLHVLTETARRVAADLEHEALVEKAEGPRDDEETVDPAPAHAAEQEPAQVLDDLHEGQEPPGQPHGDHPARPDLAAVDDPDRAPGRHRSPGILDERAHRPQEGIVVQDRVRVEHADERIHREVQATVRRVGLAAAVVLVHHDEVRVFGRLVRPPDRLAGHDVLEAPGDGPEREPLDERLEGPVGGAVVDDDDLEARVVEAQERADRLDDARLLVEGGGDDGDGRREGRLHEVAVALPAQLAHDPERLPESDQH
jgi:hypothetical protein